MAAKTNAERIRESRVHDAVRAEWEFNFNPRGCAVQAVKRFALQDDEVARGSSLDEVLARIDKFEADRPVVVPPKPFTREDAIRAGWVIRQRSDGRCVGFFLDRPSPEHIDWRADDAATNHVYGRTEPEVLCQIEAIEKGTDKQ
jgi:hypothetical protein